MLLFEEIEFCTTSAHNKMVAMATIKNFRKNYCLETIVNEKIIKKSQNFRISALSLQTLFNKNQLGGGIHPLPRRS